MAMKTRIMVCCLVLMLSIFAGSAFGGHESDSNTWYGLDAGSSITDGTNNTFIGNSAGHFTSTGYQNTFLGQLSGYWNTSGYENTFLGVEAGGLNTTGYQNTFSGFRAGVNNTTGYENTFFGHRAGAYNTTGVRNTFLGQRSGYQNTTGGGNTFLGFVAGLLNTTGYENTFSGYGAGYENTTGYYNTFSGRQSGANNTTGAFNTFIGRQAGSVNTVESYNTLIGHASNIDGTSDTVTNATAIGNRAYVSQSNSLILGSINGVNEATSNVNVGIGTSAPVRQLHIVGDQAVFRMDRPYDTAAFMLVRTDESGTPLKTFVVGANASGSNSGSFVINDLGTGVSGAGTRRLTIDNNGIATFTGSVYATSFVPTSSLAYKTNVKTYENALETVKKLRGVSFNWKDSGKSSVGLIAEEVDQVIPEVVAHNDKDATGVNYDSLVGVLVEAVKEQEERHQAELKKQQAELDTLKEQKRINEEQQKSIAALSQKVSELERLLILSNTVSKAD